MNFAEAALLIQGSTCVYSKKVISCLASGVSDHLLQSLGRVFVCTGLSNTGSHSKQEVGGIHVRITREFFLCVCVRKLAQASSVDEQGKDKDVSFAQRNDQDEV